MQFDSSYQLYARAAAAMERSMRLNEQSQANRERRKLRSG